MVLRLEVGAPQAGMVPLNPGAGVNGPIHAALKFVLVWNAAGFDSCQEVGQTVLDTPRPVSYPAALPRPSIGAQRKRSREMANPPYSSPSVGIAVDPAMIKVQINFSTCCRTSNRSAMPGSKPLPAAMEGRICPSLYCSRKVLNVT